MEPPCRLDCLDTAQVVGLMYGDCLNPLINIGRLYETFIIGYIEMAVEQRNTESVKSAVVGKHVSHVCEAFDVGLIQLDVDFAESRKLVEYHVYLILKNNYSYHSARA